MKILNTLVVLVLSLQLTCAQSEFLSTDGRVSFKSQMGMHILEATSENALTKYTPSKRKLLFKVQITSFGFSNCSRLVEKLFNDVYLESHKYHWATFETQLTDTIQTSFNQTKLVTLTGMLSLHGVSKPVQVAGSITVREDGIVGFDAVFPVVLNEYNIKVLPDDADRLAAEVTVTVSTVLRLRNRAKR